MDAASTRGIYPVFVTSANDTGCSLPRPSSASGVPEAQKNERKETE